MRPRRLLLAATTVGFALVLGLHVASPSAPRVLGAPPTTTPRASTTTTTRPSTPTTTPTTTPPPATTTPTTSPPATARTAVGANEQYGYGAISVKVTTSGTRITDVTVASLQTAESYSQQLAVQVIPTLTSEALAAQSANIQSVSGASYTSQGFAQSLQSALSQLGL